MAIPTLTAKRRHLFETLLVALFMHSMEDDKPLYHQGRANILEVMGAELKLLEKTSTDENSLEQFIHALYYVVQTVA